MQKFVLKQDCFIDATNALICNSYLKKQRNTIASKKSAGYIVCAEAVIGISLRMHSSFVIKEIVIASITSTILIPSVQTKESQQIHFNSMFIVH